MKNIPGFNYKISASGTVVNSKGEIISETYYKKKRYVRIYKNGKRYTLSINKLISDIYGDINAIPLQEGEKAFRYKDTNYYITNYCRAYNVKFNRFLKVIYRNGYPTINISYNGSKKAVSLLKFLISIGGYKNAV